MNSSFLHLLLPKLFLRACLLSGLAWSLLISAQQPPAAAPAAVPAAGQPASSAPTEGMGYYFVQITDPQFGFFTGNPRMFEQETINFEFVIASINRLRPAFVVVCGDLVHNDGDAGQVAEYKRIVAKLDPAIPVYTVSGNHDLSNTPTPEKLAFYREQFGKDWYSFRHADLYGIVLNSTIMMAPDGVPADAAAQEAWLREELVRAKASGAKSIMVFQHHPFFIQSADEADPNSVPNPRRATYLTLLKEYGVNYVFAGHLHRNAVAADGPLNMIITSAVGRPLGTDPSGLRVVIVRPNGVEHTFYGLGSVPTQVSLAARGRGGGRGGPGGGAGRGAAPGGPPRGAPPTDTAPAQPTAPPVRGNP